MAKDTFWFRHDSNAKDDPKCILLIEQLGPEGYGIFWILIELLRDQPEYKYPMKLLPSIARRYNTSTEKIKTVVMSYELFNVENETFFFSPSLLERMEALETYKNALSEAGKRGAQARLKGGLSLVKRIDKNRIEPNGLELNGDEYTKTLGTGDYFFIVTKKYISDLSYRVQGIDGLKLYMEENQSVLNLPSFAERFMIKNNGAKFNDFMHVFNTYNKFTEQSQNGTHRKNTNSAELIDPNKKYVGKL